MLGIGKTLKEEKKRRNETCQKVMGQEYEYDPSIDFYTKYQSVRHFNMDKPFTPKDCKKVKITKDVDKLKRYYNDVRSKSSCDKIGGIWAQRSLNRNNLIDDGVCWVRDADAHCSVNHDNTEILKAKKQGKKPLFSSTEMIASRKCARDARCEWNSKMGECISKEAMDFLAENSIPEVPSTWPLDITSPGFQSYLVKYYSRAFEQVPQKYMPVMGTGNRCIFKENEKIYVSQPQTVINMIFKAFAKNSQSPNRGLLIWHGVGSGKTCTAAGIMESYWDQSDKKIIFVSSVEALASNPPEAFMSCAYKYFPRFKLALDGLTEDQKLEYVRSEFDRRGVRFFTFAQLAHHLLIANPLKVKSEEEEEYRSLLNNAILIIDEVHNIFRPLPHQRHEHTALKKFLADYNNRYTQNLHLAILTATPGETIEEVVELLNMVRSRKSLPIRVPNMKSSYDVSEFAKSIKGLISYFDISSDLSKYPRIIRKQPYTLPMSMKQYSRYTEVFNELSALDKNYEALQKQDKADKYYKSARRYSNMLFNLEKGVSLYEFSSKLPVLLDNIRKYPNEKHYIYSTFFENRGFGGHGVLAIAKILEKELGYEKLDFKQARRYNETKTLPTPKRRYMLAITNELDDKQYTIGENLKEIVGFFSKPENKTGDYAHVFLASQKFNEGVDFKGIRHIHIFEPLLSYNKEIQTVGRGARYCSHKDLDIEKGEWTVTVHKYIADYPIESASFDTSKLMVEVDREKTLIEDAARRLESLKGEKGKEITLERNNLKDVIESGKKRLQNINKDIKHLQTMDPSRYIMVDQLIEKEVKEKLKDMLLLLQTMKQSSVDCRLFREFHAQSGDSYVCLE